MPESVFGAATARWFTKEGRETRRAIQFSKFHETDITAVMFGRRECACY